MTKYAFGSHTSKPHPNHIRVYSSLYFILFGSNISFEQRYLFPMLYKNNIIVDEAD